MRKLGEEVRLQVLGWLIVKYAGFMLRLGLKGYYSGSLPCPLLHVVTGLTFREIYAFRDRSANAYCCEFGVHNTPQGRALGLNPFVPGTP